jgi:hypothetical protein
LKRLVLFRLFYEVRPMESKESLGRNIWLYEEVGPDEEKVFSSF